HDLSGNLSDLPVPCAMLTGVRVLDCSTSLAAAFCTSLLQRLGAEVTRVDDDSSNAQRARSAFVDEFLSRSGLYARYVGRGKETIAIDLSSAEGQNSLDDLLRDTDLLVEDQRTELLPHRGRSLNPELIVVSVTPYGHTGPKRAHVASDLTLYHGG